MQPGPSGTRRRYPTASAPVPPVGDMKKPQQFMAGLSLGSGSTLSLRAPPEKEFPRGVRDPSLGAQPHLLQQEDLEDEAGQDRPHFYRSFKATTLNSVLAQQYNALKRGLSFLLPRPLQLRYKSEFLDLLRPTCIGACAASALHTCQMVDSFRAQLPCRPLETAVLGHLLLQHRVLILYEYDDTLRKAHARRSFKDDIVGKWNYPWGDLLILPRPPPKSGASLITCLEEAVGVWEDTAVLPGSYRDLLVPRSRLDPHFEVVKLADAVVANAQLQLSAHFKPVFFPVYFESALQGGAAKPKKVLSLRLIEKVCIALEHLCDSALVCRQFGSALALAQQAKTLCLLVDLLLEDSMLTRHLCYTHLMANWLLGNASFAFMFCVEQQDAEVFAQYEQMMSSVSVFALVTHSLAQHFPERVTQVCEAWLLEAPVSAEACAEAGLRALQELRPPPHWTRSHFRAFCLAVRADLCRLTAWTESVTLEGPPAPKGTDDLLPPGCDLGPMRDMALLARLVAARAHRYRAELLFAQALSSPPGEPMQGHPRTDVTLPFVPEVSPAVRSCWDQVYTSLGGGLRILHGSAAAGGKLWLRAFLRVVVERAGVTVVGVIHRLHLRQPAGDPAALIVEVLHSLCCVLTLCARAKTALKMQNWPLLTEMESCFLTVLALHCTAFCRVYLAWGRSMSLGRYEDWDWLLRTARYYHTISTLCAQDSAVRLAVLSHHVTELQLVSQIYCHEVVPSYPLDIRRRLHVLRRCVDALPFLWEMVLQSSVLGPVQHEEVRIHEKMLPLTLSQVRGLLPRTCVPGFRHALQLLDALPNFLPGDPFVLTRDQHLNEDVVDKVQLHVSKIDDVALRESWDDKALEAHVEAVRGIVTSLLPTQSLRPESLSLAVKAADFAMRNLCSDVRAGLECQETTLMTSTLELTLAVVSVVFAVVGVVNAPSLTDQLPIEIYAEASKALTEYTVSSLPFPFGMSEVEYSLAPGDVTGFFSGVAIASHIIGFQPNFESCNLVLQLDACLRAVMYRVGVILQSVHDTTSSKYFPVSREIIKITMTVNACLVRLSPDLDSRNVFHSLLAKFLVQNVSNVFSEDRICEDWCTTAVDVLRVPALCEAAQDEQLWLHPKLDAEYLFPRELDRFAYAETPQGAGLDDSLVMDEYGLFLTIPRGAPGDDFKVSRREAPQQELDMRAGENFSTQSRGSSSQMTASGSRHVETKLEGFIKEHQERVQKTAQTLETSALSAGEEMAHVNRGPDATLENAVEEGTSAAETNDAGRHGAEGTSLDEDIILPGHTYGIEYHPFQGLDQFMEEEERACLRFELYAHTPWFRQATGDFYLKDQDPDNLQGLDQLRDVVTAALGGAEAAIRRAAERNEHHKVTISGVGNGGAVVITPHTAALLMRVREGLAHQYRTGQASALVRALFYIDRDLFEGSMAPLLRGTLKDLDLQQNLEVRTQLAGMQAFDY